MRLRLDLARGPDLGRVGALEAIVPSLNISVNAMPEASLQEQIQHCLARLPAGLQQWGFGLAYSTKGAIAAALERFCEVVPARPG